MKLTPLPNGGLSMRHQPGDRRETHSLKYSYGLFLVHRERLAQQKLRDAKRAPTALIRATMEVEAERELREIKATMKSIS